MTMRSIRLTCVAVLALLASLGISEAQRAKRDNGETGIKRSRDSTTDSIPQSPELPIPLTSDLLRALEGPPPDPESKPPAASETQGQTAAALAESCDQFGSFENFNVGSTRYRGNVYRIEFDGVILRRIKMELAFSGDADLIFYVHRAPSTANPQQFCPVAICESDGAVGDGQRRFYSCALAQQGVPLEAGFDYAIGVAWGTTSGGDGRVRYGNDSDVYPQAFTHGQIVKRVLVNSIPSTSQCRTFDLTSFAGVYSMELCYDSVPGACCSAAGCDDTLTREFCTDTGSFFFGDRTDCGEVICRIGACCDDCGGCQDGFTPEACEARAGAFQFGAVCPAEPTDLCPPVTGACCFDTGRCEEVCADDCAGTYRGDGTTCQPNFCQGACCLSGTSLGCANRTQQICSDLGGSFRGAGTTCSTLPRDSVCGGACCFGSGDGTLDSCSVVSHRWGCSADAGQGENVVYRGDGEVCPLFPPPDDEEHPGCGSLADYGACCLHDGTCLNTTSDFCGRSWIRGVFHGAGTECGTDLGQISCATLPCCLDDGDRCENLTVEGCMVRGGQQPTSGDPSCAASTCEEFIPTGACCSLEAGVCVAVDPTCMGVCSEAECELVDGIWQGDGTDCATPESTCVGYGACCRGNGECFDAVAETECGTLGGNFQEPESTCDNLEVPCDQSGACCTARGSCLLLLQNECKDIGGLFQGIGVACGTQTCAAGACCSPDDGGTCDIRREDLCMPTAQDPGLIYQGDGTTCDPGLCTLGACCDNRQRCFVLFESECNAAGGEFSRGVDCSNPNTCQPGACCTDGDCTFDTLAACVSGGGFYEGAGTACQAGLCNLGSCCLRDGTCEDDFVRSQCLAADEVEFREGITCASPVPCDQFGACCLRDGSCLDEQLTSECEDRNGDFTPDGLCSLIECISFGACCLNGACTDETAEDCAAIGGVYEGDGSECALGLCTLGSCCELDNTCTDGLVRSQCAALDGIFRPSVTCAAGPSCDQSGACCLRDGTCVDDVLPLACALNDGVLTPDTLCSAVICTPIGACCLDGTCTQQTQVDCEDAGGVYRGDDTACTAEACPVGACCRSGGCALRGEEPCVEVGGVYQGDGSTCTIGLCAQGACCHLDGTCDEDVVASQCTEEFDVFSPSDTCALLCPVPRGACCILGSCQDAMPQLQCENQDGTYDGDGTVCRPDLCAAGACCLEGACDDQTHTRQTCEMAGGAFQGPGSNCVGLETCVLGSCCALDGTCTDGVVTSQCPPPDVFRQGETCEGIPCPPRGACCIAGGCELRTLAECGGLGGRYAGDANLCTPDDLCQIGACCRFDGTCAPQTRLLCEQQGGVYQGMDVDCAEVDCARGACCAMDGTCTNDVVVTSCDATAGSEFTANVNCGSVICEVRGACCRPGECSVETRADCLLIGGTYQATGLLCDPDPCPAISIVSSEPADCSVDARQPTDPAGSTTFGWNAIDLTFNGDPTGMVPADFFVELIPGGGDPPMIVSATPVGTTVTLMLEPAIPPGHWTCFTHLASGSQVCLGFLPVDSDGDLMSLPMDVAALVGCLAEEGACDLSMCDADRSGTCGPADLLRAIDLLQGAESFDAWANRMLDPCPTSAD